MVHVRSLEMCKYIPEAGNYFHCGPSDVLGRREMSVSSEVHDHLFGLLHIDAKVVVSEPLSSHV